MSKIIAVLLCMICLLTLSKTIVALPQAPNLDEHVNELLKCSNEAMVVSRSVEIHYNQVPASKISTASLKNGTPSNEVRRFLSKVAKITIKTPVKAANLTIQPGNYLLGLQEEKHGTGKWFISLADNEGREITRFEPIMESLTPAICTRVMTIELERRPGSNLLKIKIKCGDLSISMKDTLEL